MRTRRLPGTSAEPDLHQPQNRSDDTDTKTIKGNGPDDRHAVERCHPIAHKADGGETGVDDRRHQGIARQHIGEAHEKPNDKQPRGLRPVVPRRRIK